MLKRILSLLVVTLVVAAFAALPVVLADEQTSHEGKILKAGDGKLTMADKDGKNEHTHTVAADAKITLNDKECKLTDLMRDMQVRVTTQKGDKTVAIRIEAKTAS